MAAPCCINLAALPAPTLIACITGDATAKLLALTSAAAAAAPGAAPQHDELQQLELAMPALVVLAVAVAAAVVAASAVSRAVLLACL